MNIKLFATRSGKVFAKLDSQRRKLTSSGRRNLMELNWVGHATAKSAAFLVLQSLIKFDWDPRDNNVFVPLVRLIRSNSS